MNRILRLANDPRRILRVYYEPTGETYYASEEWEFVLYRENGEMAEVDWIAVCRTEKIEPAIERVREVEIRLPARSCRIEYGAPVELTRKKIGDALPRTGLDGGAS